MPIEIDVTMDYKLGGLPNVLLTLEVARMSGQTILEDQLDIAGATIHRIDGEAGIGQRVWADVPGQRLLLSYRARAEVTRTAARLETLAGVPMRELPSEGLTFLRPSRYCQSDMFAGFVDRQFSGLFGGQKVAAIRDWVGTELTYNPFSSGPATTVLETFATRDGVCRDYAQMVCALARAGGIPARYVSGYGPGVTPPDFHAVAQVWLEGGWQIVDATGMCTAEDLVIVGVGRDACDTAFMETTGPADFVDQIVHVTRTDVPA